MLYYQEKTTIFLCAFFLFASAFGTGAVDRVNLRLLLSQSGIHLPPSSPPLENMAIIMKLAFL